MIPRSLFTYNLVNSDMLQADRGAAYLLYQRHETTVLAAICDHTDDFDFWAGSGHFLSTLRHFGGVSRSDGFAKSDKNSKEARKHLPT